MTEQLGRGRDESAPASASSVFRQEIHAEQGSSVFAVLNGDMHAVAGPTDAARRPRQLLRRILLAFAAMMVVGGVVSIVPTSQPQAAGAGTDLAWRVACVAGGSAKVNLFNHGSRLYLHAGDLPSFGSAPTTVRMVAADNPKTASVLGCVLSLRTDTGTASRCLSLVGVPTIGTDAVWMPCADQTKQIWLLDNHWTDVFSQAWKRFHPFDDLTLCLEAGDGSGIGSPLTVERCGTSWRQQWLLGSPS